jgi:pyruvate dehydrogenase E1 component
VKDLSDKDLSNLKRGGHCPKKVYAAYKAAISCKDKPTVILAKTVKGYGLGAAGEALNNAHNVKKLKADQIAEFRQRFDLPLTDDHIANIDFYTPGDNSAEIKYLRDKRASLGGYLPARRTLEDETLTVPNLEEFSNQLESSGERELSTTMAFVRIITALCKDPNIGKRIVPIVPDEARTFGMEGLFRQLGIYAFEGQKYTPVDSAQVMFYKEAKDGQILEEGINEAGAFCSWLAAATSYSNNNVAMIPFYIYYSMFGFQRIGDLAWLAGDARARGFLIGATSGRTTLNGEGLQHEDGHSHIISATIPNCISYDPCFSYELAVIVQYGLERMYGKKESVFFYITTMNENYSHPAMPENSTIGIVRGIYKFADSKIKSNNKVKLLGAGAILREMIIAQEILDIKYSIAADVYSVTSFTELARDGQEINRWNRLNPDKPQKTPYVTEILGNDSIPTIAATDYIRMYAEQVREFITGEYIVLGTDGFGRSDSRASLRDFFEVDHKYIVIMALSTLVKTGGIKPKVVEQAIQDFKIDVNKTYPLKL